MKFHFRVNDSIEHTIECASSIYCEAAAASMAIVGKVKYPAKITIWVPGLAGPYIYLAKEDGCGNLIIGPGYERER